MNRSFYLASAFAALTISFQDTLTSLTNKIKVYPYLYIGTNMFGTSVDSKRN